MLWHTKEDRNPEEPLNSVTGVSIDRTNGRAEVNRNSCLQETSYSIADRLSETEIILRRIKKRKKKPLNGKIAKLGT